MKHITANGKCSLGIPRLAMFTSCDDERHWQCFIGYPKLCHLVTVSATANGKCFLADVLKLPQLHLVTMTAIGKCLGVHDLPQMDHVIMIVSANGESWLSQPCQSLTPKALREPLITAYRFTNLENKSSYLTLISSLATHTSNKHLFTAQ